MEIKSDRQIDSLDIILHDFWGIEAIALSGGIKTHGCYGAILSHTEKFYRQMSRQLLGSLQDICLCNRDLKLSDNRSILPSQYPF